MAGQNLGTLNGIEFVVDQSLRNDPRSLASEWFELTPTGLRELKPGQKPPLEVYLIQGSDLKTDFDLSRLRTGDLLASLTRHYPDECKRGLYEQMATMWGFAPETTEDWARVGRRVPEHVRVDGLTYSHYRAVSVLEGDPEGQRWWLERALQGDNGKRWSTERLRVELAKETGLQEQYTSPRDVKWQLEREVEDLEIKYQEERQQRILAEQQAAQYQSALDRVHAPDVARGQLVIIKERLRGLLSSVNMVELVMHPDQEWQRIKREMESILLDLEELDK